MDKNKHLDYKLIIRGMVFLLCYILLCISINSYYFSQNKISKLVTTENQGIIFPSDTPAIQSFYSPYKSVSGIFIYLYIDDNALHDFNLVLLDEDTKSLREWKVSPENILDDNSFYLSFDGLDIEENSLYHLYAYSENKNPVGIITFDTLDNGYGSSSNDGYTWAYQIEYSAYDFKAVFLECLFFVICVGVYIAYKKKIKDEIILSILYLIIALLFFIITPINSLFDEDGHFLRSYEISRGHLVSDHYENGMGKTIVPESLIKGVNNVTKSLSSEGAEFLYARQKDLLNLKISSEQVEMENPNQALYSPLSYIPQVIGLSIGNLVTKNVYVYYMFGRFFAFAINILLIILAIRLCPEKKYLIFVLASTPVFLAQMISYSADGNVNSLSIFYVAFIINRMNKEHLKISDEIIIAVGAVILALSKVIYFPFALLVLLLEDASFKSKKSAATYKILTISMAVVCFMIWFLIARTYLFDNQNGRDIQPKLQMIYMITHFYKMPVVFIETVYNGFLGWIGQISGGVLGKGWLQYSGIIWFIFMVIIGLELFIYRIDDNNNILYKSIKKRVVAIIVTLLVLVLTFSSLYVQWTSYKSDSVSGIQGRYFIPLILPISFIFSQKIIMERVKRDKTIEVIAIVIISLCGIINTIQLYT